AAAEAAGDREAAIRHQGLAELAMDHFEARFKPMMRNIAQRFLPSSSFIDADRKDCTQDGWLKFTKWILPKMDPHRAAEIRGYIRRAAFDAARTILKRLSKFQDEESPDADAREGLPAPGQLLAPHVRRDAQY